MAHLFLIAGIVVVTAQLAQSVTVSQWQDDEGLFHFQCRVDRTDNQKGLIKIYKDDIKLLEVMGDWTFQKHFNDPDIITNVNSDNATVNLTLPANYEGKNVTCMDKLKDETASLVLKSASHPDNGTDTGDYDMNSTTPEEHISPSLSIVSSSSLTETMQTSTSNVVVKSTTGSSTYTSNTLSPSQSPTPNGSTSLSGAGYTRLLVFASFTWLILKLL